MKTIAIVGGSQKSNFKNVGKRSGVEIIFFDGKRTSGTEYKKKICNLVSRADSVVVLLGACSHSSMYIVKEYCKINKVPLSFHQGFGVTGAMEKALSRVAVS